MTYFFHIICPMICLVPKYQNAFLPEASFGHCRYLLVCACVCVRVSQACPCNNSLTHQARTTTCGQKMQNNLVKLPIVLQTSKVWYCLWIRAELCLDPGCEHRGMHAWYANSTNQNTCFGWLVEFGRWKFGMAKHPDLRACVTRYLVSCWHWISNTGAPPKLQGKIWDCNQKIDM